MERKEFIKTVLEASELGTLEMEDVLLGNKQPCKVCIGEYKGCRLDRLVDRNRLTNAFGFSEVRVRGRRFWSVDDFDGIGGTFLADVLRHYGKDYWFVVAGQRLTLHSDLTQTSRTGYGDIAPIEATESDVLATRAALEDNDD